MPSNNSKYSQEMREDTLGYMSPVEYRIANKGKALDFKEVVKYDGNIKRTNVLTTGPVWSIWWI